MVRALYSRIHRFVCAVHLTFVVCVENFSVENKFDYQVRILSILNKLYSVITKFSLLTLVLFGESSVEQ